MMPISRPDQPPLPPIEEAPSGQGERSPLHRLASQAGESVGMGNKVIPIPRNPHVHPYERGRICIASCAVKLWRPLMSDLSSKEVRALVDAVPHWHHIMHFPHEI